MKKANDTQELVCIVCPNGCRLTVTPAGKGMIVTGHGCKRGESYGAEEATDPKRVVTAVVRTDSSQWPCVPVKTGTAVGRKKIPTLLKYLYSLRVRLPVRRGEFVLKNYNNEGIDIIYTRTLPPDAAGADHEIHRA
jgi:CxxC motif-containing protein